MSTLPTSIIPTLQNIINAAPGKKISLHQLMEGIGQRSFGVLLLLLGLPCMLPVPGLVSIFGAVLLLLGVQMLLGFKQPWLPARVRHAALSKAQLLGVLKHLKRPLDFIQPYIHRRLPGMVRTHGEYVAGLVLVVQALFIMVPLPFTNEPPALCIILLALAFIQQDGLLAIFSYLLGIAGIWLMLLVYGGVMAAGYNAWLAWL